MAFDLKIVILVKYDGHKGSQTIFLDALDTLRADLTVLKLPHPKVENVKLVSPGCLEFFWITHHGGTLHTLLRARIKEYRATRDGRLRDVDIAKMTLKETDLRQSHRTDKIPPPSKKRPHPYQPQSRLHPRLQDPPNDTQPSEESGSGYVGTPRCSSSSQSAAGKNMIDAQRFLDELAVNHESTQKFKVEPIETVIPPSPADPIASPVLTSPPPPPSNVQGAVANWLAKHINTGSNSSNDPILNEPPTLSTLPLPNEVLLEPSPPNRTPASDHSRLLSAPPISAKSDIPDGRSTPDQTPGVLPSPNEADLPIIRTLTRELWDIRRQVKAGVERELSLLQELRQLDAPNLPETSSTVSPDSKINFVLEARLQIVERELQDERQKRLIAEEKVKDIERECKEPFVVPALLQAFISISKLTTQSLM